MTKIEFIPAPNAPEANMDALLQRNRELEAQLADMPFLQQELARLQRSIGPQHCSIHASFSAGCLNCRLAQAEARPAKLQSANDELRAEREMLRADALHAEQGRDAEHARAEAAMRRIAELEARLERVNSAEPLNKPNNLTAANSYIAALEAQLAETNREREIERLSKERLYGAMEKASQAIRAVEAENARLREMVVELGGARQLALRPAGGQPAESKTERSRTRERLAAYAHDAWSGWMRYLFSRCVDHDGESVIPQWAVERWTRQMTTAYGDLSEGEKASDRAEAGKMLAIIDAERPAAPRESEEKNERFIRR